MTTTTNPYRNIAPPPGAFTDDWESWGNEFRFVWTPWRQVNGHEAEVRAAAKQYPDGHVDDGTLDPNDPPGVYIQLNSDISLTTDQARELGALIVATADELDRWAGR